MISGPIGGSDSTIGFARRDDYGKSYSPSSVLSKAYQIIDEAKLRGAEKDLIKSAETAAKAYLDAWRSMEQFKSWAILIARNLSDVDDDEVVRNLEESLRACGLTPSIADYYILAPSEIMYPFSRQALETHLDTLARDGDSVRQTMLNLANEGLENALQALSQPVQPAAKSDSRLSGDPQPNEPFRYRLAFPDSPRRCANCEFFKAKNCSYYQQNVSEDYVCDSWQELVGEKPVATTANAEQMRSLTGKWQSGDVAYSRCYHTPVKIVSPIKDNNYYQVTMLTRTGKAIGTALVPGSDLRSTRSIKEWQMGEDFDRLNAPSHDVDELKKEIGRILNVFDEIVEGKTITDSGVLNPLRELIGTSLGGPLWVKVDTGNRRRYYRAMQTSLSAIAAARQLLFTAYRYAKETGDNNFQDTYQQIQDRVSSARKILQESLEEKLE